MTVRCIMAARLRRLPIDLKHLRFHPEMSGYADYIFGARAGPNVAIDNLFHELAHAAEFGPEDFSRRCFMGSFWFKVPKVKVLGGYYPQFNTGQATEREFRTCAYQLHLMQAAGMKRDPKQFADYMGNTVLPYMPDAAYIKEAFAKRILQEYDSITQGQALERLQGWLSKTGKRLKRVKAGDGPLGVWFDVTGKVGSQAAQWEGGH